MTECVSVPYSAPQPTLAHTAVPHRHVRKGVRRLVVRPRQERVARARAQCARHALPARAPARASGRPLPRAAAEQAPRERGAWRSLPRRPGGTALPAWYTWPALESGRPVRELAGEPQHARSTLLQRRMGLQTPITASLLSCHCMRAVQPRGRVARTR